MRKPKPLSRTNNLIQFRADEHMFERLRKEADEKADGNLSILLRVILRKYFRIKENEIDGQ